MRIIAAIILGVTVASIIFFMVGFIDNALRPIPEEMMDPATPEAVAKRVASTPISKWLVVLFGFALGAFSGGFTGVKVARGKNILVTSLIGSALSIWAFYTFYVVYPLVLSVPLGMLISAFLFSYLGGVIAKQPLQKNTNRSE